VEAQRNATLFAANAMRSQDEARRKLSLELHDDPIQTLISVCYALDTLKDIPPAAQKNSLEVRNAVAGTIDKLRAISIPLRPPY